MTDVQNVSPKTASVDVPPEDYVTRFTNQKTTFLALIAQLNNERIELLIANDIEKIDTNTSQLNSAIETVKSLENLIASEKESRAQSEAKSSPKNMPQVPDDQLPKFEVDPNASALYKLTRCDNNNSTDIQTVDLFLQEFEKKLRAYNVSISEHWFSNLETCFQKSDTVSYQEWFNRIFKKSMAERIDAMTWKEAKETLKVKFDYTYKNTPTTWMKHLLNYRQSSNESMTKTLRRFYLYCVGSKISTDSCPLLISLFVSKLYTVQFQNLVTSTVEDFVKLAQSANHPAGSVLNNQDALLFDMSWKKFEYIVNRNIDVLEKALQRIFEEERLSKLQPKKRKLPPVSTPVSRKTNIMKTANNNKNDLPKSNNPFQNGNNTPIASSSNSRPNRNDTMAFGNNGYPNHNSRPNHNDTTPSGNNGYPNHNNTKYSNSSNNNSRPNHNDMTSSDTNGYPNHNNTKYSNSSNNNSRPNHNDMTSSDTNGYPNHNNTIHSNSNNNSHPNHNATTSFNSNGRSIHNDPIPFNRNSNNSRTHSETPRNMNHLEKITMLKNRGICTMCQTEKFTYEHINTCYARNRMAKRRQERPDRPW